MLNITSRLGPAVLLAATATAALGQSVPDTQPGMLSIIVEQLKVGADADHEANESGWPAAFAKANYPYSYLAMSSITGPNEVWFISPFTSFSDEGESMKIVDNNSDLGADLARLWRADGEYLSGTYSFHAMARPDLSHGDFPDLGLARFWEITTFRVRLGHETQWEEAAKVYLDNVSRNAPGAAYRIYQVTAGLPGSNYLIFSSVNSYGDLDRIMADGMAMWEKVSAADMAKLQGIMQTGVMNVTTNRYRLSPTMSYVDAATKAKDPAFWNGR